MYTHLNGGREGLFQIGRWIVAWHDLDHDRFQRVRIQGTRHARSREHGRRGGGRQALVSNHWDGPLVRPRLYNPIKSRKPNMESVIINQLYISANNIRCVTSFVLYIITADQLLLQLFSAWHIIAKRKTKANNTAQRFGPAFSFDSQRRTLRSLLL